MENYVGSDFDDLLEENGILVEAQAIAAKRVIALQVEKLMKEQNLTKTEMSRRMKTSRTALDRLLDSSNNAVTLQTLDHAARALGKRLQISIS